VSGIGLDVIDSSGKKYGLGDPDGSLLRHKGSYDPNAAYQFIKEKVLETKSDPRKVESDEDKISKNMIQHEFNDAVSKYEKQYWPVKKIKKM